MAGTGKGYQERGSGLAVTGKRLLFKRGEQGLAIKDEPYPNGNLLASPECP